MIGWVGRERRLKREIWFKKLLWSYMPCSPMGLFVLAGLVFVGVGGVFLGQWLLRFAGVQGADDWPYLLLFPTVVAGWIIAERHS